MNFDTHFIRFLNILEAFLSEVWHLIDIVKTFKNDGGVVKNEGFEYMYVYRYECTCGLISS